MVYRQAPGCDIIKNNNAPRSAHRQVISMSNMDRSIKTNSKTIMEFVTMLAEGKLLIPTFQREFIWTPENIIKLWDSIYRFYPIGSILYWVTETHLNIHRQIGGYVLPDGKDTAATTRKWAYILDGQQRATSLLVSLLGGNGKIKERNNFDFRLYFDMTDATFFFAHELNKRQTDTAPEFLVRLTDVPTRYNEINKQVRKAPGFNKTIGNNLKQLHHSFADYIIPMIRIHGIDISGVCDIFERINQEGAKLESMDIWIARTFRNDPTIILEK